MHPDFHPAFGRVDELDVVHEAADQENAATARLQQIFGRQRIGDRRRIESLSLIADPDREIDRVRGPFGREFDEDMLAGIVAVPVPDRVDDRLADRDPDIMLRVVVQRERPPHVVADDLRQNRAFRTRW